jgi:hypothetical protein
MESLRPGTLRYPSPKTINRSMASAYFAHSGNLAANSADSNFFEKLNLLLSDVCLSLHSLRGRGANTSSTSESSGAVA